MPQRIGPLPSWIEAPHESWPGRYWPMTMAINLPWLGMLHPIVSNCGNIGLWKNWWFSLSTWNQWTQQYTIVYNWNILKHTETHSASTVPANSPRLLQHQYLTSSAAIPFPVQLPSSAWGSLACACAAKIAPRDWLDLYVFFNVFLMCFPFLRLIKRPRRCRLMLYMLSS